MIAALTGIGLAISAGLNAFIPLISFGLIARYTAFVTLPPGWEWLSDGWFLILLSVLVVADFLADKIPVVDNLLDVVHTVIRPTSGGIAFSAGFGSRTITSTEAVSTTAGKAFGIFLIGLLLALAVHVLKAMLRAAINLTTSGLGGPIASTLEDLGAMSLALSAAIAPVAVVVLLLAFVLGLRWLWRRRYARGRGRLPSG